MKKLNLNQLQFVLFFALIFLIASCGKEEIEENLQSSENTVALTESKYQDATNEVPPGEFYSLKEMKEMKFENFQHKMFKNDLYVNELTTILDGTIQLSDNLAPNGKLAISSSDLDLNATLTIEDGIFYYQDEDSYFWIDPLQIEDIHQSNGEKLNYFTTSTEMIHALQSGEQLNAAQKAVFSILALGSTDQFLIARDQSKQEFGMRAVNCSWYDYTLAGLAAAPVAIVAAIGCSTLTAGCTVGGTLTFGGVAIPCFVLIGGCATGGFASTAGVYSYLLNNWLCEEITCVFSPPSNVWVTNTAYSSAQLNWNSVSGAQKYQVVQWYYGTWYILTETTSTNILITGIIPGYNYYFGVRTVCNNTATNGVRWTHVCL